jgi:hypothetical protein
VVPCLPWLSTVVAKTFPVDAALVRLHVALTLAEAVVVDALHAATLQISRAEGLATTTILQGLNVKCVQRLATLQKSVGIDMRTTPTLSLTLSPLHPLALPTTIGIQILVLRTISQEILTS